MIKPSTHPGRVLLALLIAPLVGCIFGLWFFTILDGEMVSIPDFIDFLQTGGMVWLYSLPLSVPLGAAVHLALLKLRLWPVTAYTLIGLLLGPVALAVWLSAWGVSISDMDAGMAWLGAITGGITALTFRLLIHKSSESPSFPPAGTRPY